jgi:hypothetical protein
LVFEIPRNVVASEHCTSADRCTAWTVRCTAHNIPYCTCTQQAGNMWQRAMAVSKFPVCTQSCMDGFRGIRSTLRLTRLGLLLEPHVIQSEADELQAIPQRPWYTPLLVPRAIVIHHTVVACGIALQHPPVKIGSSTVLRAVQVVLVLGHVGNR